MSNKEPNYMSVQYPAQQRTPNNPTFLPKTFFQYPPGLYGGAIGIGYSYRFQDYLKITLLPKMTSGGANTYFPCPFVFHELRLLFPRSKIFLFRLFRFMPSLLYKSHIWSQHAPQCEKCLDTIQNSVLCAKLPFSCHRLAIGDFSLFYRNFHRAFIITFTSLQTNRH